MKMMQLSVSKIQFKLYVKLLFVLVFNLNSCKTESNKQEFTPIEPEKMADIIKDISIVDGVISLAYSNNATDSINPSELYNEVVKKHGIRRTQLDSNLKYYAEHYFEFEKILNRSIEKLNHTNK